MRVSWVAERQAEGPWGLDGGGAGAPGSARYRLPGDRRDRRLSGKAKLELPAGAELELRTPGGGGFGKPA
jgi:N-methylhydantoinase B/oxoprolinase/acetone carboxylase alpha subunit